MWLRSATTALVVALTDGGLKPGKKVTLVEPVDAMHTFGRDPSCRAKAPLRSGGMISAIEIQRHYLHLAERHLNADFMPPWAPQVCQHWRAILDRLEQGAPDSVAFLLDWAIKYSLFTDRAARRGLSWDEVQRGSGPGRLDALRQELFQIDIRFGQLGERGIFAGLDRAGVELLNRIGDPRNLTIDQVTDYLLVLRFSGLAPRPEMAAHLQAGFNWRGDRENVCLPMGFREHWGAYLMARGQWAEAETILEGVVQSRTDETRVLNRSRATLANAKRLLGKTAEARSLLEQARPQQLENHFQGDLTDFTYPNLAKLLCVTDPSAAVTLLSETKLIQSRARNRLGLIRTLLLDARLAASSNATPHGNEAILALSPEVPALATCKLFQQVMERWEIWTHDPGVTENGDVFWGL